MSALPEDPSAASSGGNMARSDEIAAHQPQRSSGVQTFCLAGLFALAVLTIAQLASAIVLPVVLAVVLNLVLQPAVQLLDRIRVPRALGGLLIILLLFTTLVGLVAALSVPASTWAQRLPEGVPRLESHLRIVAGPLRALQAVIGQAEEAADSSGQKGPSVSLRRDLGITGALVSGTRAALDGLFTTAILLYFLLVSSDAFLRRLIEVLPTWRNKRQAVDIFQQIKSDVSVYLLTISCMNLVVGAVTALAMYLCGLGDPLLWGALAFLLNYIPILGPLLGTVVFLLAGMLTFNSFPLAALPPAMYFGVHLIEGETITPMLLARRFTLNPVLVIFSLLFWFWMWGVPGAVLAVPMLAVLKIVCDRVDRLQPLGHVMEG